MNDRAIERAINFEDHVERIDYLKAQEIDPKEFALMWIADSLERIQEIELDRITKRLDEMCGHLKALTETP